MRALPPSLAAREILTAWLAIALLLGICGCDAVVDKPTDDARAYALRLNELGRRIAAESRLTGSSSRSPENSTRSSNDLRGDHELATLLRDLAKATPPQAEAKTPDQWTAVALAKVLYGQTDAAITVLEQGLALYPDHPRMQSDLSGALLLRASSGDALHALELANRAIMTDPSLATSWFNRALGREDLFLYSEAKQAWADYLEVDPSSSWAATATQRQADLETRIGPQAFSEVGDRFAVSTGEAVAALAAELATRFKQQSRETLQNRWLARWGEAVLTGDPGLAHNWRERCRALALALAEPLLVDETTLPERLPDDRARELALAYGDYSAGQESYTSLDFNLAASHFERASSRLETLESGLALWARYYRAVCWFQHRNIERAAALFAQLAEEARQREYTVLLGYATWMQGVIATSRQQFNAALGYYLQTHDAFTASRELQNLACSHFLLAELYRMLGTNDEAWRHISAALSHRDAVHNPRWIESFLREASFVAQAFGYDRAALDLVLESVTVARDAGHPAVEAEALVAKALVHGRLEENVLALADLDAAQGLLPSIEDLDLHDRLAAQVDLARGRLLAEKDPRAAEQALSHALTYYDTSQTRLLRAEIHLLQGKTWLATDERERARAALEEGVAVFEADRRSVADPSLRIAYFDRARALYDQLLELEMTGERRPDVAFSYVERGRARDLLDTLMQSDRFQEGLRVAEITAELPSDTALVTFASLPRSLVVWVFTQGGVEWLELPVTARALEHKVEAFRSALLDPELAQPARRLASELYTELLLPLEPWLADVTSWVIVPDKELHALPFAALLDPATERFVIEDHLLRFAASVATFMPPADASRRPRAETADASGNVVIFGDPAIDEKAFPGQLVHAEQEARDIAELYGVEPWLGQAAMPSRFLALAPDATILHFAGHALANQEDTQLSYLLLATEDGDPGTLFANQISQLTLHRTRLVVLSACSTAQSRISAGEGVLGLARAFLTAGAPQVVASLWDAGDFVTAALMPRFHAHLSAHGDPALALRQAQLELLTSPDLEWQRPFAWAGFAVFVAH